MISTLKCDMSELSLKCDSSFFLQNKTLRNQVHTHTNFNKVKFIFFFKIKFLRGHIYNKRFQFSKLFFLCLWCNFFTELQFFKESREGTKLNVLHFLPIFNLRIKTSCMTSHEVSTNRTYN